MKLGCPGIRLLLWLVKARIRNTCGQDLGTELVQRQIQPKLKVYHNVSVFQRADVAPGLRPGLT